jgi:hypothetical protein
VSSFLVVWNGGSFDQVDQSHIRNLSNIPVRFRVEPNASMNNRYRPDPELDTNNALLILDDDLRIDCRSIQLALRAFHRSRRRNIVGWFPRLAVLPHTSGPHDASSIEYVGEPGSMRRNAYNMILSGAAFVSTGWFADYSAPELAGLREIVDAHWNCDGEC